MQWNQKLKVEDFKNQNTWSAFKFKYSMEQGITGCGSRLQGGRSGTIPTRLNVMRQIQWVVQIPTLGRGHFSCVYKVCSGCAAVSGIRDSKSLQSCQNTSGDVDKISKELVLQLLIFALFLLKWNSQEKELLNQENQLTN